MTRVEAVAAFFQQHPNVDIDGLALAQVGGVYGWRTRVAEARKRYAMRIENRVVTLANGSKRSYYKFVPAPQTLLEMMEKSA